MTVLVSDSFNRGNSNTTLGTTDSYAGGTATAWTVYGSAVYGVTTNQAYLVSTSSADNNFVGFDIGIANVKLTTQIFWTAASFQPLLAIRATANNNFIQLQKDDTNTYVAYYYNGSSWTKLGSSSSGIAVTGDTIEVTVNGSSYTVKRNGTQIFTFTSTTNQTATKFGINGSTGISGDTKFDNFIIEDLVTGGTTTYTGSGTLQGTSTLSQPEKLIYKGSGTIQGTSNVSSVEKSILKALGTLQGFSSLTSSETYTTQTGTTYIGGGTLQGSSIVSGNEHYLYKASGTLQGISSLSSGETLILFTGNTYSTSGTIQGFSTLSASERIIYKEISTAVGYSDSAVHEIVTLLASGIAQGYSNVLLIDKTEVIAQVSLIGKQRIEVTLIGKQKLDTIMQGKQRITINLKGVMK